ncbi:CCC motif membrane protein [Mesonia sediminis]|uniref:CCC motif membrane protein n=1 Tax=Mesonia sediminis TaxID=1703946 RepID=A0ABW5SD90_9FLAO
MELENRKLPNATLSLILGILSFIACCFSAGLGGVILSGVAFYLANKDTRLYHQNPDGFDNYSQVKTAKIIAIIGLVIGLLVLISSIAFIVSLGGINEYFEYIQEMQMKQLEMQGQ